MKNRRVFMICLLLLAFGSSSVGLKAETLSKEFKVKPGQLLTVDLDTGGRLVITGWDKNIVSVTARIRGAYEENIRLNLDKTFSGVRLSTDYIHKFRSHGGVDLDVKVPRKFDLQFDSKGGDLIVRQVEGEFSGQTAGGDLNLTDVKGVVDLETMGGDIELTRSELDGSIQTMGGDVDLDDLIGTVDCSTMGGDITYRNPGLKKAKKPIELSTMGGDILLESAPAGAEMKTMGGDIRVNSAANFIKARTMGGDIEIDELDGWVRASTAGGDVEVTILAESGKDGRDIDLSSKGGDIILTVPADLPMNFDITLTYTREYRRMPEIISDFDLDLETTQEWDTKLWGSPRKYIYGKGKVGDGRNTVKLKTINGRIVIRKG
ncbi:MAG: DUF4097 family beta strand repeat-containing protein [Candidatus Neomarinimicrobiota bacterium]